MTQLPDDLTVLNTVALRSCDGPNTVPLTVGKVLLCRWNSRAELEEWRTTLPMDHHKHPVGKTLAPLLAIRRPPEIKGDPKKTAFAVMIVGPSLYSENLEIGPWATYVITDNVINKCK